MAAYTLPEGFTEFDMFTFGTALLVGGEWAEQADRDQRSVTPGRDRQRLAPNSGPESLRSHSGL